MSSGMTIHRQIRTTALLLLVLCFIGLSFAAASALSAAPAGRNSRWAAPVNVKGLPNLFQVTPDLYRSAQPDETGMLNARGLGIRTVLSLRVSNKDLELSEGTGLFFRRVPITTWNVRDDEIVDALRIIRVSPGPVLVHCLHGADRTGLIIAMYRMVFEGWSKEEARDELLNGGYGFHSMWTNIPKEIDRADIEAIRAEVFRGPSPNGN